MEEVNFTPEQTLPEMYSLDTTKITTVEEVATILNALQLGLSKEYAEEHGISHLLGNQVVRQS